MKIWGVLGGLGATVVAGLAVELSKGWVSDVLVWLWSSLRAIGRHLAADSKWPNGIVYVLALVFVIVAIDVMRSLIKRPITFRDFTSATFWGVEWKWGYPDGLIGRPNGFCPYCHTRLLYEHTGNDFWHDHEDRPKVSLHCQKCNINCITRPGRIDDLLRSVGLEIERMINSDQWRQYVPGAEDHSDTSRSKAKK